MGVIDIKAETIEDSLATFLGGSLEVEARVYDTDNYVRGTFDSDVRCWGFDYVKNGATYIPLDDPDAMQKIDQIKRHDLENPTEEQLQLLRGEAARFFNVVNHLGQIASDIKGISQ